MSRKDRLVFKAVVPRAARKARRVLTVSERTRRDLRELYAIPDAKIVVTPNGVDPVFTPGNSIGGQDYVLFVGAVQERKNPLAALAAAEFAGPAARHRRPGEGRGARPRARAPRRADRGLRGRGRARRAVPRRRVPRPAVPLRGLRAARARGDGVRDAGRRRPRAGAAGGRRRRGGLGRGARARRRDPPRGRRPRAASSRPGSSARACSRGPRPPGARSRSTGRRSAGDGLGDRRLARARRRAGALAAGARAAGRRSARDRQPAGQRRARCPRACACSRTSGRSRSPPTSTSGSRRTTGEYVLVSNPDAYPEEGAIAELVRFADAHPSAGLVGPLVLWPDGTWQPSLRRFPTVLGTIWRRTPLRLLRRPYEHQVSHYGTRPTEPVQGDWLLGGACLLMRRRMLEQLGGWDGGYRHYIEDIDVAYRAAQAGWERWLVPAAVVRHDYAAVIDKRFLSGTRSGTCAGCCASSASTRSGSARCASRVRRGTARASPCRAASRTRPGRRGGGGRSASSGRAGRATNVGVDRDLDVERRRRRREPERPLCARAGTCQPARRSRGRGRRSAPVRAPASRPDEHVAGLVLVAAPRLPADRDEHRARAGFGSTKRE